MSCETNSNRVGRGAGVKAGISAAACKFSNAAGPMASKALAEVSKNKVPIAIAGLAMGGVTTVAASVAVAPAPVKEKVKGAAATAGGKAADAAGVARQAAGTVATSARGAAAAAGGKVAGAVGTAQQAVSGAIAPARGVTAAAGSRVAGAASAVRQAVGDAAATVTGTAADALGAYADKLDQVGDALGERVAPVAGKALGVSNSPITGAAGGVAKRMLIARSPALAPVVATAGTLAWASRAATGAAATRLARISRTDLAGTVVQDRRQLLFFKGKEAVNMWKSSLTDRLNRADLMGSHRLTGEGVYASDGVMFETRGGRTWHRGTSIVSTSQGQRTITHLQSLTLPAQHYYFDRRIGDEQAVGIATRRVNPRQVPGFVGAISPGEALCPGWAGTKRAMIRSVLYWGERGKPS
jgi:hypothetical protein